MRRMTIMPSRAARPTERLAPASALIALLLVAALSMAGCSAPPEKATPPAEDSTVEAAQGQEGSSSDGTQAEGEGASAQAEEPATVDWTAHVENFSQFPVLQGGCEVAALSCVLRSMGYAEVDEHTIADQYLTPGDMVSGYSGDPYTYGASFPPPIVNAANAFLESKGATERASELTPLAFDGVLERVQRGYPVVVWTTMYMAEPQLTGTMVGPYPWWNNEHCVVVYGVDEAGNIMVMDPIDGMVTRDRATFVRIYEACGSIAYSIS